AGGALLIREVNGGNGYSSQSSTRVHIGLGAATRIDELEVRWPSGRREKVPPAALPIDHILYLKEGSGVVTAAAAGFGRAAGGGNRPARPSGKAAAPAAAAAGPLPGGSEP
ncbi:MAG TPA: ASPIC/UnbV domain-containing protein, partial [Thermoanaerobaculia bacterium]|nr:ASPIC/UnbV domain-containing protein [Thermoanaerobaculia bacterium]